MYVPEYFAVDDRARILDFIKKEAFGTLVSCSGGEPFATHVPFVILSSGEPLVLGAHVARRNPQWKTIEAGPVLAMFTGAHAHISAAWYADPASTVPTWNYSAIHCSARAKVLDDAGARRILELLVAQNEGPQGWSMQAPPESYIAGQLRAIVAISLTVERIDAQFKFSQNRTEDDRNRVIRRLADSESPVARQLGEDMSAYYAATSLSEPLRRR